MEKVKTEDQQMLQHLSEGNFQRKPAGELLSEKVAHTFLPYHFLIFREKALFSLKKHNFFFGKSCVKSLYSDYVPHRASRTDFQVQVLRETAANTEGCHQLHFLPFHFLSFSVTFCLSFQKKAEDLLEDFLHYI